MQKDLKPQEKENTILLDVLFRTLRHWPWLVLSIIVCLALGYLHLKRTPPVYTETESVLIKEDSQGSSATSIVGEFNSLGLVSSNINIQNELTTFKSLDLMKEVVRRLDLMMNYSFKGRFHDVVAYGKNNPIYISMPDMADDRTASFNLSISPNGTYTVSDLSLNENDYGSGYKRTFKGRLGDTIVSPMGKFAVMPSLYYKKGEGYEMKISKMTLNAAAGKYEGGLKASLENKNGTIINLSLSDRSIERADNILVTLVDVYNDNWVKDKNLVAVSTSSFIDDRLAMIEKELREVDSDISSYKSASGTPNLGEAAKSDFYQKQQYNEELLNLTNQLQMAQYIKDYLNSPDINSKPLPSNIGVEDLRIESLIGSYNKKFLDRKALLTYSSAENPLVQDLNVELQDLRGAIKTSVDNAIISLQSKIRSLEGATSEAASRLAKNPSQANYLQSVERQQSVKESLYLFLLQKREDNELNQAFTAYNTRIIKAPSGSGVPTSPRKNVILAGSFLIGLVLPFAFFYVLEITNTRIRGRKDVESLTVPMLGEIPQVGKAKRLGKKDFNPNYRYSYSGKSKQSAFLPVVKAGKRDVINEAFRVLRTNMEFTRIHKDGCDVVAITSFNPSSGKSFISMNFAISAALKKLKVLVIDGDMRHASASRYIGNPEKGLSDYLAGNVNEVDNLLVQYPDVEDLWVLPVGSIPPNPTELLETKRFGEMIESLRKEFEYIIIDCPPIEVVADAQLIDKYADRTIFIVRAGLFEKGLIPVMENLYEDKKYKHMAYILNGTSRNKGRYGYGYSYKYGYGYGYGYSYDNNIEEEDIK